MFKLFKNNEEFMSLIGNPSVGALLFANIETILMVNQTLLSKLELMLTIEDCEAHNVGRVFLDSVNITLSMVSLYSLHSRSMH